MLKPLALYMLLTLFDSLMMLSELFEVNFSAVSKFILDDFVWSKGTPFILKNENRARCSCGAAMYMLVVKPLAPFWIGSCVVSCLLGKLVWMVHICSEI